MKNHTGWCMSTPSKAVQAHENNRPEDALKALEAMETYNLDVMSRLRKLVHA